MHLVLRSDQYSRELSELIIDMLRLDPTKRPQINEIMCNPLVINAYMSYYADMGMIPIANRPPGRTISFSTDGGSLTGAKSGAGTHIQNNSGIAVDSAAKPSLKQVVGHLWFLRFFFICSLGSFYLCACASVKLWRFPHVVKKL